jgi:hypothetical protein
MLPGESCHADCAASEERVGEGQCGSVQPADHDESGFWRDEFDALEVA